MQIDPARRLAGIAVPVPWPGLCLLGGVETRRGRAIPGEVHAALTRVFGKGPRTRPAMRSRRDARLMRPLAH